MKEPIVEQIWFERKNLGLKMSFAISRGTLESSDNVFFFVKDSLGNLGLGEAAPFPVLTLDTADTVVQIADEILQSFVGKSVDQSLQQIRGILRQKYWADSPTVLTGLEMAFLDLRARQMDISLSRAFGTADLPYLRTDITLPIMDQDKVSKFWGVFSNHGFSEVKVKVGATAVSVDADRVEEIYRCVPADTRISLDGNQGCTVESSLKLLDMLLKRGITPTLFEQPLPEKEFEGMAELTRKSTIPICADELVKTKEDAIKAIVSKSCRMINLKFMKSGIHEALMIANIAKSAGLDLMIGGMVESEIAMTASLHFACGGGMIDWLDLDTPFFFQETLTQESPWHSQKAKLICPGGKGMGLIWKG